MNPNMLADEAARIADRAQALALQLHDLSAATGPVAEATPAAEEVPDHLLTPIERKLRHPKRPAKKQLTAGTLSGPPAAVPAPKPEP